jgi:hypothetical protein
MGKESDEIRRPTGAGIGAAAAAPCAERESAAAVGACETELAYPLLSEE